MGKKSKGRKLLCCPGVDRISQLPDNIIDNILIRLPIADAARTSVLSRKWNHAWINISELKYDDEFDCEWEKGGHPITIKAIYCILMLHMGPIVGFELSLASLERVSEIDPVFHFLSRKGVQDLDISIFQKGKEYRDVSAGCYILPSHFYSCLQLRCLKICHCTLNPPCNFGGFRNLNSLELVFLELTTSVFDNLISKCPLLEELSIDNCVFLEYSVIKINASNLVCFHFDGVGSCFRFTSAPQLKSLTYYDSEAFDDRISEEEEKSPLEELCNALPVLESLEVDNYFLQSLEVRDIPGKCGRHLKWLHRLKSLEVKRIRLWNMDEVMSLLGVIGSSPNLQQLLIRMADRPCNANVMENPFRSLEANHLDFSPCKKLEVVSLQRIVDCDPVMDLVKLLLLKSPNLKTMHIKTFLDATPDKRLEIVTKVTRFRRASVVAEIDFC